MRLTRVYVPAAIEPGATLELPPGPARHLARVLRLAAGASVVLFDGRGGECDAVIDSVRREAVTVRVAGHRAEERESPLATTLLQGIARGEKMDLIVQKATELGVWRIVPLVTAHSNVRLTGETARRRQAHWQAVAIGACEQCGRNRIPEIAAPVPLAAALAAGEAGLKLILTPDPDARSLRSLLGAGHAGGASVDSLCLLVGPEGGFDTGEIRAARLAGFAACRLGPRVLRTETAALAALAALQLAAGDLG